MSDGCALCRRLPSGHFCYQDFLSFATGSSLVGTVGAAGAGLLPFDQGEPAEAVGSVLWLSFALPSSRTLQLLRHLCLISLGGQICSRLLQAPSGTWGSASFLLPSCSPPPPALQRWSRCFAATSGAAASCTSASLRPCISTEALVSHVSSALLPPARPPHGVSE